MNLFQPEIEICTENILGYISQKEIMEKYLGVSVDTVGMFKSPLREDKNPTCTFSWSKGKLYFRDWAIERPLDCFGVVMSLYNVNFKDAQKIIAKDFNIRNEVLSGKPKKKIYQYDDKEEYKSIIEVKVQPFTKDNISYLKSYHLTSNICKEFNVYSPKYIWLNKKIHYVYSDNNPALAYYFGLDDRKNPKWKIYFYKNDQYRFLCNTNRINGWIQIPEKGNTLIFTKSLKDVMCLSLFDIPAVAMQAESQTPYDYIIKELQSRYNKIISLFDYDSAGIRRAMKIYDDFDIPYFFIQDEHAKDFSDYIQYYGIDKSRELIGKILHT